MNFVELCCAAKSDLSQTLMLSNPASEGVLLNESSRLSQAFLVSKFIVVTDMILFKLG